MTILSYATSAPHRSMELSPAQLIADRYSIRLSALWQKWFDEGVTREGEGGEFSFPVSVAELLVAAPGDVWPGLMLPDTLPILGNGYGDWLCLRVNAQDSVAEVIHWYHGGGDWLPWGNSPAEAITFDRLRPLMPGRRIEHSIRPEARSLIADAGDALAAWAVGELPADFRAQCFDLAPPAEELCRLLVNHRIALEASLAEQTILALDGVLRKKLDAGLVRKMEIPWDPIGVQWVFDENLLHASDRSRLCQLLSIEAAELDKQDWDSAATYCRKVISKRDDLGWAWDVLGWDAERRGHLSEAARCYGIGLLSSSFSDQSIRFRTHWFPDCFGKFAAFRLWELRDALSVEQRDDPLLQIYWEQSPDLKQRVSRYWLEAANQAAEERRFDLEFQLLYRAGWDLGLEDLAAYETILARLSAAAKNANQPARAALAQTHLDCFQLRLKR